MKLCKDCGKEKLSTEFPSNRQRSCKECKNATERQRYACNKEVVLIRQKSYYEDNKEARSTYDRSYYLKKKFGISIEEYELLKNQADGCPICGSNYVDDLDHDHATGQLREFLCGQCNRGLGVFKDNPNLLRRAAEYLERHLIKE